MILSAFLMALFDITRGLFENLPIIVLVASIIFLIFWAISEFVNK